MSDDSLQEARVKAFLLEAKQADPERYAVTCDRFPVKSRRQLERIAKTEVSVGLYPGRFIGDIAIAGVTEATFAELALLGETA